MDGFPLTQDQANLLESAGFQPHMIFQLEIGENAIVKRAEIDLDEEVVNIPTPQIHNSELCIARNKEYLTGIDSIKTIFDSKYSNWVVLDGTRSKWSLSHETQTLSTQALERRQNYLDLKSQDKATPIFGVGLSNNIISNNPSKFLCYCPYSLVENNELRMIASTTPYLAEYLDQFYFLSSQVALDSFLSNPQKYASSKLPDLLPLKRPKSDMKSMFPQALALKGYCPVTFAEGPTG